ncbi:MAG: hypothetical protein K9W46_02240 [Candidatus Heimdallarchaeum endolithica]|uniref:Uncharacterized protein n=1 Tax=Candidatus Heimdallarchaeum endolithica TaxID=2876572 RepID=A0A9Y1BS85_9ARCH|nr:MAG: hypothetical protein K9W46_02240 [Candidatus Heimdallarchaeum endolithica]
MAVITYQCNYCSKKRTMEIPSELVVEIGVEGLTTYVDVHDCKDSLDAIILYVDEDFNVRSQVQAKKKEKKEKKEEQGLNIPMPKKSDLRKVYVDSIGYSPFNLQSLKIKDHLRQTHYIIEEEVIAKVQSIEYRYVSRLGFIEITVQVSSAINKEIVDTWFTQLANSFESLVVLDEEMLHYVAAYLETRLVSTPQVRQLLELDLLLNSTISVIYSNETTIEIYQKNWREIIPEIDLTTHRIYKKLISLAKDNSSKKLLAVYSSLLDEITIDFAFPAFLQACATLIMNGLMIINKMKFVTVPL